MIGPTTHVASRASSPRFAPSPGSRSSPDTDPNTWCDVRFAVAALENAARSFFFSDCVRIYAQT